MTQEKIKPILEQYHSELPNKACVLKQYRLNLENGLAINKETQSELYMSLHKLAGSLGMYGYTELSSQVRKVMEKVQQDNLRHLQEDILNIENALLARAKQIL